MTEAERAELESVRVEEEKDARAKMWARKFFMKFEDARRGMAKYLRSQRRMPPKWIMVTGFYPESECCYGPGERRKRLRALNRAVVLLVRRELKRCEMDPHRKERTVYWEPAIDVCVQMEISSSKLSRYLKEFCGCSLSQVIDCVKAEGVRKRLKEQITTEARRHRERGEELGTGASLAKKAWEVFRAMKRERRERAFSYNLWAGEFGFSSYKRMYRACASVHGMTPQQMELEAISRMLEEQITTKTQSHEVAQRTEEFKEWTLEGLQAEIVKIGRYRDPEKEHAPVE